MKTKKPNIAARRAASLKGWRTQRRMKAARRKQADYAAAAGLFRGIADELQRLTTTPRPPAAEALPNPWLEINKAT